MNKITRLLIVCAALLLIVPAASANWSDNFDSYALNSGLHGQGGWEGWEGSSAADAFVTDVQAYSAPHSAGIIPTSDIVQSFNETSGDWEMTAWCYVPSSSTGQQYFIMLNKYPGAAAGSWSVELQFDSDSGIMYNDLFSSTASTAIICDQWVEVKIEIHLDLNVQSIYYDGTIFDSTQWQDGGVNEIAGLDLFSSGGSTIYWDDCSLISTSALVHSTWGNIKTLVY